MLRSGSVVRLMQPPDGGRMEGANRAAVIQGINPACPPPSGMAFR